MAQASPSTPRPALSFVLPACREGTRLRAALDQVLAFGRAQAIDLEAIAVIDGPDPEAADALAALREHPAVRILVNPVNRGKGYSVRRGVEAARGRHVIFTDVDLSVPLEYATALVKALEQRADVAIASRAAAGAAIVGAGASGRRAMSRVFNWVVQRAFLPGLADTQCGFKGFRLEVAQRLFALQRIDRFAFDVEVLWLARRLGYRVAEVPVANVGYTQSAVRRGLDSAAMLRDLVRIAWLARRGAYDAGPPDTTERRDST